MNVVVGAGGAMNLQATLAASSAGGGPMMPHHPITCAGRLWLHEDGRLECAHARTEPGDQRTQRALEHSVAILLIELYAAG